VIFRFFLRQLNTVFKRYRDWVKADVFVRFRSLLDVPDMEYAMVDATIVKVHAYDRAQKGDSEPGHRPFQGRHDDQDPGADRCAGNLVRFVLLPAIASIRSASLRHRRSHLWRLHRPIRLRQQFIIADLNGAAAKIVISQHPRRVFASADRRRALQVAPSDRELLLQAKEFKRIAMRADKTDQSFAAIIHLAAAVINSR